MPSIHYFTKGIYFNMSKITFFKPFEKVLSQINQSKNGDFADCLYDAIHNAAVNSTPPSDTNYFYHNHRKCISCALTPEIYIVVVGFHHKKGSIIEHIIPKQSSGMFSPGSEFEKSIAFSAIPDAAHISDVC